MKRIMTLVVFAFLVGCSPPQKECPPEKVCPPPPACPACAACPTCEVCPAPLAFDAIGTISMWVLGPGWRGTSAYIAATAFHSSSGWTYDLINSTGGPKSLDEMKKMLDPAIALDHALAVARANHGQGTANVNDIPFDYGEHSSLSAVWANTDDNYRQIYTASVVLVK